MGIPDGWTRTVTPLGHAQAGRAALRLGGHCTVTVLDDSQPASDGEFLSGPGPLQAQ